MRSYYWQSIGQVVNQVYEVEASNWEDVKRKAFPRMDEGDVIVECNPSAVKEYSRCPEYHYIDEDECTESATLNKGVWATYPSGNEYLEEDAWNWSDDLEMFYNDDYEEFTDWKTDEINEG